MRRLAGVYFTSLGAQGMASPQTVVELTKLSDSDKEAVLIQMERILSSSHFRNSRRYTDLLRFVVRQTVDGHADILKERTLGIEVFARDPSFDTSGDSIVRVAAAEVRKRIAQYYQEEGHEHELRVDLPSGSYVARFRPPSEPSPINIPAPEPSEPPQTGSAVVPALASAVAPRRKKLAFAVVTFLLVAIASIVMLWGKPDNGVNRFWGPVFDSSTPVLVCVGTVEPSHLDLHGFTTEMANNINAAKDSLIPIPQFRDWPAVSWADAVGMTRITEILTRHGKTFLLRSSDGVTLADLRNGPVVLLGVLENSWSLRLAAQLRFHPRMDFASQKMWIEDSQHPERKDWSYPWGMAYSGSRDDYALITRARDPLSGQISVEIGGLGLHASQAASEFVTNPVYLNNLSSSLRDPNRNVQIVLRINVINGEPGPPHIVAEYYW
jgi:hypothetical protein